MARIIPSATSARHVEAALDHDLDGDGISDAARAIYSTPAAPPADHLGVARPSPSTHPFCAVCRRATATSEAVSKINDRVKVRVCDDLGCRDTARRLVVAMVEELDKLVANGTLSAEHRGTR